MRRILVTGASGFVGGHLLPALRAAFPAATLLAATRGEAVAGWDGVVPLDLEDAASCAACIAAAQPQAVVHLAAQAAVPESFRDPPRTWRINLLGTLALAEALHAQAPEALFLHVSSAEVYGLSFQSGAALAEDAPLRPANPYAASKAATDIALGEMALRGLRCLLLRPFNHTGTGQRDAFAVASFARQAALIAAGRQPPVLQVGALDRWRDFLDVRDVCAGYVAALRAAPDLPNGAVFNLCSGQGRRMGDILAALLRLAGVIPRIEEAASRLRPTDVISTLGDPRAARAALGWAPQVAWEDSLASLLADWRQRIG